jgi:methylmalonyl-CoA mutase C-terminal domain/subunit
MSEEASRKRARVLIAKPGLDGHDQGAKIVAYGLRDAGFEVIYTGLRQTPEQIAETALEEDVDLIGLSILSGAHMSITRRLMALMEEKGIKDKVVFVGGIIPKEDIPKLKEMGVEEIFISGASISRIIECIDRCVSK